jgi:hypothetical protein
MIMGETPAVNEYWVRPQGDAVGTSTRTSGVCADTDPPEITAAARERLRAAVMRLPIMKGLSISDELRGMREAERY